ncbi:MAG: hypothetical protein KC978_22460, partial [Candidatus Omnitrophica bacterium]|nr:hypothetical protein [Candidatus Omnitrophota bacterium]
MQVRHRVDRFITLLVALILFAQPLISWGGYPGRVLVQSQEVRWGQYKNINGVRGIEFPNP